MLHFLVISCQFVCYFSLVFLFCEINNTIIHHVKFILYIIAKGLLLVCKNLGFFLAQFFLAHVATCFFGGCLFWEVPQSEPNHSPCPVERIRSVWFLPRANNISLSQADKTRKDSDSSMKNCKKEAQNFLDKEKMHNQQQDKSHVFFQSSPRPVLVLHQK